MKSGFSLIELLIVLMIIGILITFAYPTYQQYLIRAHRHDGQAALLDLANRLENYYADNQSYQRATIATGTNSDVLSNPESPSGWYLLSITQADVSSFTIQATPTKSQATLDKDCQSLTFNSLGIKSVTQGAGRELTNIVERCWN